MKSFLTWWDRTIGPVKFELLTVDFNSIPGGAWFELAFFTVEYGFRDRSLLLVGYDHGRLQLDLFFFHLRS